MFLKDKKTTWKKVKRSSNPPWKRRKRLNPERSWGKCWVKVHSSEQLLENDEPLVKRLTGKWWYPWVSIVCCLTSGLSCTQEKKSLKVRVVEKKENSWQNWTRECWKRWVIEKWTQKRAHSTACSWLTTLWRTAFHLNWRRPSWFNQHSVE